MDRHTVRDEILRFLETVQWKQREVSQLQILDFYERFLKEELRGNPGRNETVIQHEFSALFGKCKAWSSGYAAFSKLPNHMKEKLFSGNDLRIPFWVAVDLARDPSRETILTEALAGAQSDEELTLIVKRRCGARRQKKTVPQEVWEEVRVNAPIPQAVREVSKPSPTPEPTPQPTPQPTSAPTPAPTPMPRISTLPSDEQLEAIRDHFTLRSYRPGPRNNDLPPIPQPKGWDPDKVLRVQNRVRVRDD